MRNAQKKKLVVFPTKGFSNTAPQPLIPWHTRQKSLFQGTAGGKQVTTQTDTPQRQFQETSERKLSRSSVPRIRTTVAILQDYAKPGNFSAVDFTVFIKLCALDREAHQIVSLIDGVRSIQEIQEQAASAQKAMEDPLEFFRLLHSRRVIEFQ
jgi:hypothetical protein